MVIAFNDEFGFIVIPDECEDCGEPRYDTGCDAPGCDGVAFPCCGTGCDLDADPEDGACAKAIADENDVDRDDRIGRERAAFGLTAKPSGSAS